jgi:IS30 family transposase
MTPAQIINAHQNGASIRGIAAYLGVHHRNIQRIIERGADYMSQADNVAELVSQGKTFVQVAEELGMTHDAVKSCFKRIKRSLGPQAR